MVGSATVDVEAVLARRDSIVHGLDDSSQVDWAQGAGIGVVRGRGRLAGAKTVIVTAADGTETTLTAEHAVVLATGTGAAIPPLDGLREARPWISRDVTNIHEIPRRIVIIGGGVVACEAATWLRGLGVEELTIVQPGTALVGRNEPFVSDLLVSSFEAAGVTVRLGRRVEAVARPEVNDAGYGHVHGGEVSVTLDDGTVLVCDEVVAAVGRTAATRDLGLETVGVDTSSSHGYVPVDDHLTATGVDGDWLYAVGDVNGRILLTHMGKYQARLCGEVIAARAAGRPLDDADFNTYTDIASVTAVPQVTFTDPEVGSAGLTEAAARQAGIDVETAEYDLAWVAGSSLVRDDYVGRAKIVVDKASDTLVGATFVGTGIAELVHSATTAIVGKVPVAALWHTVPSYPTVSEIWLRLLETLYTQRRKPPTDRRTWVARESIDGHRSTLGVYRRPAMTDPDARVYRARTGPSERPAAGRSVSTCWPREPAVGRCCSVTRRPNRPASTRTPPSPPPATSRSSASIRRPTLVTSTPRPTPSRPPSPRRPPRRSASSAGRTAAGSPSRWPPGTPRSSTGSSSPALPAPTAMTPNRPGDSRWPPSPPRPSFSPGQPIRSPVRGTEPGSSAHFRTPVTSRSPAPIST